MHSLKNISFFTWNSNLFKILKSKPSLKKSHRTKRRSISHKLPNMYVIWNICRYGIYLGNFSEQTSEYLCSTTSMISSLIGICSRINNGFKTLKGMLVNFTFIYNYSNVSLLRSEWKIVTYFLEQFRGERLVSPFTLIFILYCVCSWTEESKALLPSR
jgi:hypothetical protein